MTKAMGGLAGNIWATADPNSFGKHGSTAMGIIGGVGDTANVMGNLFRDIGKDMKKNSASLDLLNLEDYENIEAEELWSMPSMETSGKYLGHAGAMTGALGNVAGSIW